MGEVGGLQTAASPQVVHCNTHTRHAAFGLFSINRKVGSSASLYEQTNKRETSSFLRVIERRTFEHAATVWRRAAITSSSILNEMEIC